MARGTGSSELEIQDVGVGHARIVDVAWPERTPAVVPCPARSGDVHAALSGALPGSTVMIRRDDCRGPFVEHALGNARQGLTRAARNQRDDCALMVRVERARTERFPHLLRELPIRTQSR